MLKHNCRVFLAAWRLGDNHLPNGRGYRPRPSIAEGGGGATLFGAAFFAKTQSRQAAKKRKSYFFGAVGSATLVRSRLRNGVSVLRISRVPLANAVS